MNILQNHKDKPLFEVPEHFFEQFQSDVMQKVLKEERELKVRRRWISAISIAASFTIIFMLSYFLFINRNTEEHFYVYQEITQPEEDILALDSNFLAEVNDNNSITSPIIDTDTSSPIHSNNKTSSTNNQAVAAETIVYNAVDFYVDDYQIDNFCDVMCELECYYDY